MIVGGNTIAVIACGLNYASNNSNSDIFNEILDSGGCIITEYDDNILPDSKFFRKRNRIISGLAIGTLVIEASYISGARITARFCNEQKKPLFCLPNSIGSKNSAGTNMLLKQGAIFTTCIEDILNVLCQKEIEELPNTIENMLSEKELIIYKLIKERQRSVDEIENITKMPINEINALISMLELNGYVVRNSNTCVCLESKV